MNLIEVYQDTKDKVNSGEIKTNSKTEKWNLSEIRPNDYPTRWKIGRVSHLVSPRVIIEPHDTVTSAIRWSKVGKVAILNMASARRPGGGVEKGARAQEESLFRCSNLFDTIPQDMYPIGLEEAIYTKDAVFFKDFRQARIDYLRS